MLVSKDLNGLTLWELIQPCRIQCGGGCCGKILKGMIIPPSGFQAVYSHMIS